MTYVVLPPAAADDTAGRQLLRLRDYTGGYDCTAAHSDRDVLDERIAMDIDMATLVNWPVGLA